MDQQKKQLRKGKNQRLKDEDYVEFVDEDHADILDVVNTIDTSSLPPHMKLLWDDQMKQLSAKSPKGHRWDPRQHCVISWKYIITMKVKLPFTIGLFM